MYGKKTEPNSILNSIKHSKNYFKSFKAILKTAIESIWWLSPVYQHCGG